MDRGTVPHRLHSRCPHSGNHHSYSLDIQALIKLRFVKGNALSSDAIELRSQIAMPFTPSHVECVTPEGKYAGQHIDGGMLAREPGYDKASTAAEAFFDLPATDAQTKAFYDYVQASIGQPYDWKAIIDFAVPVNFHTQNAAICSAKMALALRKANWFKWPLAVPAHLISPRDLLLMLSGIVEIPH